MGELLLPASILIAAYWHGEHYGQ